jgi:signal transduction histidine kinase
VNVLGRIQASRFTIQNLPLFWKLLIPFLSLILVLGVLGAFLIVRDLSARSQATLDQELLVRSLDARSLIHDSELYLLESANFAANLQGMAEGLRSRNVRTVTGLLQSVLALKTEVTLVGTVDRNGSSVVEFHRSGEGPEVTEKTGTAWANHPFISQALQAAGGEKAAGFVTIDGSAVLAIAAPVCSEVQTCVPVGLAVVAFPLKSLAAEAGGADQNDELQGVAIYDSSGALLASSGNTFDRAISGIPSKRLVRLRKGSGSTEKAILYAPLEIQGVVQGTIGVSLPTAPAFASVRGAGVRLSLILLAGMAGIVAIGALLSRFLLKQVRPLMETNRALGSGDLGARVPVLANDELGELARGVNQMADQLQASYETLEMRVSERTEEVRRLLRERTDFFTAISHEFRTPLAVILSQAEIMLDPKYPRKDRWGPDAGRTIKDSGEQLLFLINDILELAKAEAGQIQVTLQTVSLLESLRELRRTVEGLTRAGGLTLTIDMPKNLPFVLADRTRLREIILNLVDNAAKYTPQGGLVTIAAVDQADQVEVTVADTGVGIPKEAAEKVFEPFYRVPETEAQRGQPSTGLGLALAKRLVEAQGGELWFTNNQSGGTTFTFTLKKAESSPPDVTRNGSGAVRTRQTVGR